MNLDPLTIISVVLGAVAVVAGGFWLKAKGKIGQLANLVKQAYEVVAKVADVLEDNTVTKDEVAELKKELADVKEAAKALIGR